MQISEHPKIKTAYAEFLAAVEKLGAAVRAANVVRVGQRVTWKRRGKQVEGVIAEMRADAPWYVLVMADGPNSAMEYRKLDNVSLL